MNYKKTTLPNGLRIITVPIKGNRAVTVMVIVETGSNYESKEQGGLSHFLEHMCFKGTEKRPKSVDISKEIDALGASNNAFTSNEFTGYYAKGEKKHMSKLLDITSDLYLHATLPESELEKERGVIIQEIKMYEDLPQQKVSEVFATLLYGDTPSGRPIGGPIKNIEKFTRKDFEAYRAKHYVASKTIVTVAGDIEVAKVEKEIAKVFFHISTGTKVGKERVKEVQTKPALAVHKKKTDQTHMIMGFRAYDATDKRLPILRVLGSILAGGMSSRLFQKLREEMGVCYYVRAGSDEFNDHGYFAISTGVDVKRVEEVIKVLVAECRRLTDELVSPEELKKTQDYIAGHLYLGLETSDSLAEFYTIQEVMRGKIKIPSEVEKEIRSVTAKDIQKVAREIFKNEKLNLAIVGDIKDANSLKQVLKF